MANEDIADISPPANPASLPYVTAPTMGQVDAGQHPPPSTPGDETPAITKSVLAERLSEAELMLANAAETGNDLSPDVVATITNARDAYAHGAWTPDLTKQFWPAYGRLCASIKPVTGESLRACSGDRLATILRRYRTGTLYLALLILPLSVVMFINASISNEISDRIRDNNALALNLHDKLLNAPAPPRQQQGQQAPGATTITGPARNNRDIATDLQQFATANRLLYARVSLLNHFILNGENDLFAQSSPDEKRKALQLPVPLTDISTAGYDKIRTYQDIRAFAKDVQQMNLTVYGAITAYLLPILYALLGACAYALRSLSQQILAKTYTPTYADLARIIIALIAGLIVGLFNNFTQGISLSPLVVAFLVGYAVEIFFSFLDTLLDTLKKVRS